MLKAVGCQYVIIGHSERRQYFGETDETVLARTRAALDAGLAPIIRVGESPAHRESGKTDHILHSQCPDGIVGLSQEEVSKIQTAYDPVWAIGTAQTAHPQCAA